MGDYYSRKPAQNVVLNDLICGCIMGGAIGDAFGYPIRSMKYDEIKQKYGDNGITAFDVSNGFSQISDNTQMMLYTANAIVREKTKRLLDGHSMGLQHYIRRAYDNWHSSMTSQEKNLLKTPEKLCWIYNVDIFRAARTSGNTSSDTVVKKNNTESNGIKDCGRLIPVAPIGCFFWCTRETV